MWKLHVGGVGGAVVRGAGRIVGCGGGVEERESERRRGTGTVKTVGKAVLEVLDLEIADGFE